MEQLSGLDATFLNLETPAAPTHVLIIPRKHIATIADATPEDAELIGRLVLTANTIARQPRKKAGENRHQVSHMPFSSVGTREQTGPSPISG